MRDGRVDDAGDQGQGTNKGVSAPFFSVVIPCYNRADRIADAATSVLAQTEGDFELIVVDDGSKDDPAAPLAALGDARIRCIRQDNAGAGAARNTGIDAARGRFIAFLDSDDAFLPEHLARTRAAIEADPARSVIFSQVMIRRFDGATFLKPPRGPRAGEPMPEYLMCDRGVLLPSATTVERGLATKTRFPNDRGIDEDLEFMLALDRNGGRFHMIAEPTVTYDDAVEDANRVSYSKTEAQTSAWLDGQRPLVGERAFFGYRGWHLAKIVARRNYVRGLAMYLQSVLHGAYRPRMAATVLLQVALPPKLYVNLSRRVLRFKPLLGLAGYRHGAAT
ncbi:glycosyltransferase family 2 protein [Sphingomonas naphthae]|uniref:Glycosyltransferase family 2 protein n=1 Tax=Sphingomonas naphthae TaxID=1813468 RepID=A0ABY7TJ27_9SPHN|nr:glycosyltransferase family 2 protein [Sphingomonas naphthae]WCT73233.1 glycosyltransferase family 2 protein [Sphingomonas naphthae]